MVCSMLLGIIILQELGTGEPLSINQPVSWVCIDKDPTSHSSVMTAGIGQGICPSCKPSSWPIPSFDAPVISG